MVDEAARIVDRWSDGDVIDISGEMKKLALAVVSQTLFGISLAHEAMSVASSVRTLCAALDRILDPRLWITWAIPFTDNWRVIRAVHTLRRISSNTVKARESSAANESDLLGRLVVARQRGEVTTKQIRDEVTMMMIAGSDSSSEALSWALYLLARHRSVQEQLHAELDEILVGERPSNAAVDALKYTRMVVLESLRLYPPIPFFDRKIGMEMSFGEYSVPAGSAIFVSPYLTHRDARFFADPNSFNPDRWSNDGKQPAPHAFFPFSMGPRVCIGENFAMVEMILALATLTQHWRFELADEQAVVPEPQVVLRPKFGIRIVVRNRQTPHRKSDL